MTKVELITGATGSGKTYTAINKAKSKGRFAYIAPTGALCFDTFKQYQESSDTLSALGIKIDGDNNHFTTYNLNFDFNEYETIIIDECHWAFEFNNHGYVVNEILKQFKGNIILVTGTINFKIPEHWQTTNLETKNHFNKEKVSWAAALELMELGKPTLVLCQTKYEVRKLIEDHFFNEHEGEDGEIEYTLKFDYKYIRSGDTPLEIYEACKDFNEGKIKVLVGTNILAQGVNLACENLIILDERRYADDALNMQKFGRLGRMNLTNKDTVLTYNSDVEIPSKIEIINSFDNLANSLTGEEDYAPPEMSKEERQKFLGLIVDPKNLENPYQRGESSKVKMAELFKDVL